MKRKVATFAMSLIVIIFLPIMLLGLTASVNEYQDQDISGAIDCNGPLSVMLFLVPSLVVYAAGAIYYVVLLNSARRNLLAATLMVLCVVVVFAASRKAWAAYSEKSRAEHQATCGAGW